MQQTVIKKQAYSRSIYNLFFLFTSITIVSACVLAFFYGIFPHENVSDTSVLLPGLLRELRPKPQEKFVFIVLALAIPFLSFLVALTLFSKHQLKHKLFALNCKLDIVFQVVQKYIPIFKKFTLQHHVTRMPIVITLLLLLLPLVSYFIYFPFLYVHGADGLNDAVRHLEPQFILVSVRTFIFSLVTFFAVTYWYKSKYLRSDSRLSKCGGYGSLILWMVFTAAIVLEISAFRVHNELAITNEWRWYTHFEAVIYSIAQVMAGKTLLVDLPSQYGLYPELLRPLFEIIPFSILNLLMFFAMLQIISLWSIFFVISRVVHDGVLRFFFGIGLLTISYGTYMYFLDTALGEPLYYQYFPIRFFWPAVSFMMFYLFSKKTTLKNLFLVSAVGAVGTLWNMDTGLMIVLAFAGVLVAQWLVLWFTGDDAYIIQRRRIIWGLLIHFSIFFITCLSMFSYLAVKGGQSLHFDWLFGYQKIFYNLGFCQEPLPLYPHPWMSILGIYLLAIIVSVHLWALNPLSKKANLLGFLSLLGLGLFVYFSGRSSNYNLIASCWPALCIVVILADNTLRAMRAGLLSHDHIWFSSAGLTLFILLSVPFALGAVKMSKDVISQFEHRNIPASDIVNNELNFIKMHSKSKDDCVILSAHQGFYYAVTKMASPIPGPGFLELMLKVDRDNFIRYLTQNRYKCVFMGQNGSAIDLGVDLMQLLEGYNVVATNSKKTMLYLKPK